MDLLYRTKNIHISLYFSYLNLYNFIETTIKGVFLNMHLNMHLDEMLEYNKRFVESKDYEPYKTDSIPNKRMVVFTCMESRLVELLPKALNIHNGDVKMLKNAGAIIRKPFDTIMKSILVAIYELQAEEVTVIGHHDCGMSHVDTSSLYQTMIDKGVEESTLK